MKITLLNSTPIDSIVTATSLPYQSKPTMKLVKNVWDSQHRSIARHGSVSFLIEGVSQSLLRQISRHPHINLTVKSTRYCDMSNVDYYTPNKNMKNLEKIVDRSLVDEYKEDMNKIMDIYKKWKLYEGDKKEVDVAKLFLPLASTTDLVVSGNYQAIYEFCQLRNCVRAEEEIRELSLQITKILKEILPEVFDSLGCKGDEYHVCPEVHGACGKYPTKKELGL